MPFLHKIWKIKVVRIISCILLFSILIGIYTSFITNHDGSDGSNIFSEYPNKSDFRRLNYGEWNKIIEEIVSNYPPELAWEYLKFVSIDAGEIVIDPHISAHIIGNSLFENYGVDGIQVCTKEFAFGCYHGVMEDFLIQEGPENIKKIEGACMQKFPNYETTESDRFAECIHGIGHGLLVWEEYNIDAALLHCDKLDNSFNQQIECSGGVFMENSDFGPSNFIKKTVDVWGVCRNLEKKYQFKCGWYHPLLLGRVFKMEKGEIAAACIYAPTEILSQNCIRQMGAWSVRKNPHNIERIKMDCSLFSQKELNFDCIGSAAYILTYYEFKNWKENSQELCETLSGHWREECINTINKAIKKYIV